MTLDQFTRLCQQEWADRCGDVTGLSLVGESRAELTGEIAGSPGVTFTTQLPPVLDGRQVGALLTEIANPVTRSVVKVSASDSADLAHVARPVAA